MIPKQEITGLLLAGGRGTRMGGVDKGLQHFNGIPLALHGLRRLQPQVGQALLNANRNLPAYEAFGVPVWPDGSDDYAGPLAGFMTGMQRCTTPYLLTVPCDTPLFPKDLVARLAAALERDDADIAMAAAPEDSPLRLLQPQPVFCLMRVDLLPSLQRFTEGGGRKIGAWTARHHTVLVPFAAEHETLAFYNANTLDELHSLETRPL